MREIIDIDQLSEWCVPVRVRGYLLETRNPLREDMTFLDQRLKRRDYETEAELSRARRTLLNEMIQRLFIGDEWQRFKAAIAAGEIEPLSSFEQMSIVFHYSIAYVYATQGKDASVAFMQQTDFNLIEEERKTPAATAPQSPAERNLPKGMYVSADGAAHPIGAAAAPQKGEQANS